MPFDAHRYRIRLLALLIVTGIVAAALIFIKFQLEDFRKAVQAQVEEKMGAQFQVGAVDVDGLRAVRVEAFTAKFESETGPAISISVPLATVHVDFVDLLYGRMTIDRIHVDQAEVTITRPADQPWTADAFSQHLAASGIGTGEALSFRVTGENCTLNLQNVSAANNVSLRNMRFDITRLPDSPDINGTLQCQLGDDPAKQMNARARYTSRDDFDLRIRHDKLLAEDVNLFLPAPQQFVQQAELAANLRVAGYPGAVYILAFESSFKNLQLREQPNFVLPTIGALSAMAAYDANAQTLELTTANLQSEEMSGALTGAIYFDGEFPRFDLRLRSDSLSVTDMLNNVLPGAQEQYGEYALDLKDSYQLDIVLTGTSAAPELRAEASMREGAFTFTPAGSGLPEVSVDLGMMQLQWNSLERTANGTLNIAGGTMVHKASGLTAENISGVLVANNTRVVIDPLTATVTDNPFVGRLEYDIEKKQLTFSGDGVVSQLEKLPSKIDPDKLSISGAANLRVSGVFTSDKYSLDLSADLTKTQLGYEWWLQKPVGVGATLEAIHVQVTPQKSIKINGDISLDAAHGTCSVTASYAKGAYRIDEARVKSDTVDVATANKCLNVGYAASGGVMTDASLVWKRTGSDHAQHTLELAGKVSDLTLLPEDATVPHRLKDVDLAVTYDNSDSAHRRATTKLSAADVTLPAFGDTWFVPLRPNDPELAEKFPPKPRDWDVSFSTSNLEIPPWKGTEFSGTIQIDPTVVRIPKFTGKVEGGSIEGDYTLQPDENISVLNATWNSVPATYFIEHLKFPELLTGTMSGNIAYSLDLDDPGTLRGEGAFEIRDGQFSADFLFAQMQERLQSDLSSMPPSLKFATLKSQVALKGDNIQTPDFRLETEGITITGTGGFVVDGDMDYSVNVSITPDTAERIALLRDNLNIEGHRISQNNIDLGFRITGPTFAPSGQVTGLPSVGVTLVSGAFEVTSEAIKVIDIPRQILLDLFKIGGGIVGATR